MLPATLVGLPNSLVRSISGTSAALAYIIDRDKDKYCADARCMDALVEYGLAC